MAARRKTTRRRTTTRRAPAKRANPVRRRRRNPKAGITPQELRNLAMSAAGGAAAGAITNYLDQAKPKFLESVPTEGVAIIAGAVMTAFGKPPAIKHIARGMVAYGAGELARPAPERWPARPQLLAFRRSCGRTPDTSHS